MMESEKSEKSVIGGGWRLSGEDTLASDPKVGWGGPKWGSLRGRCVRGSSVVLLHSASQMFCVLKKQFKEL